MFDLSGRVAIVTGAGRGVGRAHAIMLASHGCSVVVNDLGVSVDGLGTDGGPADEVVGTIKAAGGRAVANYGSIATAEGPRALVDVALAEFGRLDIVINNAGFELAPPFPESKIDDFRRMFDVHVFGTMELCLAAWPHLVASGSGRIVNTVSSTIFGMANRTGYGAAKAAILGFTRSLAIECLQHGIRVNSIAPTAGTRMAEASGAPEEVIRYMREAMPPHLVSPAVVYLSHPDCAVNGETFVVGGGKIARVALCEGKGFESEDFTPQAMADLLERLLDPADLEVVSQVRLSPGG